jgi:hypothetical protein
MHIKTRLLVLALSLFCFGCGEDEGITIEDLYAQPLSIIQECVQGKWKIDVEYGGILGSQYLENTFVDIHDNYCIFTSYDGSQRISYYMWKKCTVLYGEFETWVMWDTEYDQELMYFMSIRNDTLTVRSDPPPNSADIPSGWDFIRIK